MPSKTILILISAFLLQIVNGIETIALAEENKKADECKIVFSTRWTPQEIWVWSKIKAGEEANFNLKENLTLNPRNSAGWKENRVLRPEFLGTILLKEPYRNQITPYGVRITGAWFKECINLSEQAIFKTLFIGFSRFEGKVKLFRLQTNSLISFLGSKFLKNLNMMGLDSESDVFLRNGDFSEVILENAKIKGALYMGKHPFIVDERLKPKFNENLRMNGLEVGESLFMNVCIFLKEVDFSNARIEGNMEINGSKFNGPLYMVDLIVGKNFFINEWEDIENKKFIKTQFNNKVILQRAKLGNLFIENSEFFNLLDLVLLKIRDNLFLSGGKFSSIYLQGARIDGEIWLAEGNNNEVPKWSCGAKLILSNTNVGALQDHEDAWPEKYALEGFTYNRIGGYGKKSTTNMVNRDVSKLKKWLFKQDPYSPQPYKQLAEVLEKQGHKVKADEIRFAGKQEERKNTPKSSLRFWWLLAKEYIIGYGYEIWMVLIWMAGLVSIGTVVISRSKNENILKENSNFEFKSLEYSLDLFLPIVKLREKHYTEIYFKNPAARWYFYVHQILGYVFFTFLIAGLSGLVK